MTSSIARALIGAIMLLASGCAAVRPAQRVAVDYNRAFAESRDETMLLNILRAAGRQPLQFSTMGTVTGSARGSGSISLPFANLIGGSSPFTLSPSLSMSEGNPNLSIIPLAHREFVEGILKPITPEQLNFFAEQGWNTEFLLPLAIGAVRCPDGSMRLNGGDYREARYHEFAEMFAGVDGDRFSIARILEDHGPETRLRMVSKDAVDLLRNGAGAGRRVAEVTGDGDHAFVVLQPTRSSWVVSGLDISPVCSPGARQSTEAPAAGALTLLDDDAISATDRGAQGAGGLRLRSVASMINFIGESQRILIHREMLRCSGQQAPALNYPDYPSYRSRRSGQRSSERVLFRVGVACGGMAPGNAVVSTTFNGRRFFLPPLAGPDDTDRTLKTLAFLSELIALQTSQSLIESSSPSIAVQR